MNGKDYLRIILYDYIRSIIAVTIYLRPSTCTACRGGGWGRVTRLAAGQGSSVTQAHPRRPAKPTAIVMGGRGAGGISFESGKQESNWKFFLQAFLLFMQQYFTQQLLLPMRFSAGDLRRCHCGASVHGSVPT